MTVLTRLPPRFAAPSQRRNGVTIERLPASTLGRRSLPGRALDFVSFIRSARRYLASALHPGDVLVSMTDPPLLGAALEKTARARKAHHIHWVQDIFPEVAAAVSGLGLVRTAAPWRNRAWRAAFACVAPGEDMAAHIRAQGVDTSRIVVSENWAPQGVRPTDAPAWRRAQGLADSFVLMYSGNLGRVHDFAGIPALASALTADPRLQLVFVGEGARKAPLQRAIAAAGVRNVHFLPAQSRDDLSTVLSAGDLHLVTLREGCQSLVFPSKLYGIAAVGRPVLVLGPDQCEPARLVVSHGFGRAHSMAATRDITATLRELASNRELCASLGQAALVFATARGGADRAIAAWNTLLNRVPAR